MPLSIYDEPLKNFVRSMFLDGFSFVEIQQAVFHHHNAVLNRAAIFSIVNERTQRGENGELFESAERNKPDTRQDIPTTGITETESAAEELVIST